MSARAVALALAALLVAAPAAAAPDGDVTWAVHISLAPTWFDPAETPSVITPFMMLYALHDAVVKPMPGNPMAPSLAESWTVSKDGLAYDFVLRRGVRFHNGEPVTAEDVKFSLERYRGGGASTLKARVAGVDVVDPQRVRIRLKQPWPDFMTFYGTPATGAAWVVPKKYVERVGDDGFKRAPVGAGPYRFVSFNPGVELVLEANEGYWRKPPSVKRLIFRSVPDDTTRLAMLKRGEADIAYAIRGALAGPHAQGDRTDLHGMVGVRRAVRPEVALGRPARPPRGEPRHGSQSVERVRVPRLRARRLEHHPARLPVLLGGAAVPPRSGARAAAAGRGRLPARLRRRRPHHRRRVRGDR